MRWKYMTPEEKGALLLAYHEGKVIEWWYGYGKDFHVDGSSAEEGLYPAWDDCCSYRVKPEPVVKELVIHRLEDVYWTFDSFADRTWNSHKITFNLVDGEPDCNSIKMTKL